MRSEPNQGKNTLNRSNSPPKKFFQILFFLHGVSEKIGHPFLYNKAIKNRGTQNLWKTKIRVATYRKGQCARKDFTMKNAAMMKKNAPKFIDDTHVRVTKEFAKNARIFGTPEYKLWRAIKLDCPEAEMVTKTIKKNPNKQTSTKNMTYEHMAIYIRQQDGAQELMLEFKKQVALSKVQTNPYRCVLAWFIQKFENYDDYKNFFAEEAKKKAQEKDIFTVVKSSASIVEEDIEEEFDLASGM